MNQEWTLRLYPRYGPQSPGAIQSVGLRLKELLAKHCRGPYDEGAIKMRLDAIVEGVTGSPNPRSGIRTYPFAKNLLCAEINIRRSDWEVPLDSYRRFLWLNVDRAIWSCVQKLEKKKVPFDTDKLRQHLLLVEAEFFDREVDSGELDSAPKGGAMPVDMYPEDELYQLVIQYRIEGHGTMQDYDRRVKVESLLDELLSEADLGNLDGGDIGSGTANIFCFVKPGRKGTDAIIQSLRKNGYLDGAVIQETIRGEAKVVWPPDYSGEFSIL
jgi:hypothetical protein